MNDKTLRSHPKSRPHSSIFVSWCDWICGPVFPSHVVDLIVFFPFSFFSTNPSSSLHFSLGPRTIAVFVFLFQLDLHRRNYVTTCSQPRLPTRHGVGPFRSHQHARHQPPCSRTHEASFRQKEIPSRVAVAGRLRHWFDHTQVRITLHFSIHSAYWICLYPLLGNIERIGKHWTHWETLNTLGNIEHILILFNSFNSLLTLF